MLDGAARSSEEEESEEEEDGRHQVDMALSTALTKLQTKLDSSVKQRVSGLEARLLKQLAMLDTELAHIAKADQARAKEEQAARDQAAREVRRTNSASAVATSAKAPAMA